MVKLGTARDAVACASEVLECFGGAGYIEDTGLPQLLRDAQVLSIWEGTTNVLSLDLLRALSGSGIEPWLAAMRAIVAGLDDQPTRELHAIAARALEQAPAWLDHPADVLEANARTIAMNLYRTTALVELSGLAHRSLAGGDEKPLIAARNYATPASGSNRSTPMDWASAWPALEALKTKAGSTALARISAQRESGVADLNPRMVPTNRLRTRLIRPRRKKNAPTT